MSTYIDLDDGRSWWAANWAYDAVVEQIALELDNAIDQHALAASLREQTCSTCGPGLGSIDVRELSTSARIAFRQAAERACSNAEREGGGSWRDPSFFPGWIATFKQLIAMWEAIDKGLPAGEFGDSPECQPPSGRQVGPGWNEPST